MHSRFTFNNEILAGILLLVAALSRILPHPPNFAPITAMAVFAGWTYPSYGSALASVLLTMFASDLALGLIHWDWGYTFHGMLPVIYGTFALIIAISRSVARRKQSLRWATPTLLAGSAIFFVVTNFFVWLLGTMYPKSWEGLVTCFVMAIPFYHSNGLAPFELVRNAFVGDVFYGTVLFGGYALGIRLRMRWLLARSQ
jgi:hypothetical protein